MRAGVGAGAVAAALFLGGCGGGSTTTAGDSVPATSATPAQSTTVELTSTQIEYRDAMGLSDEETVVAFTYSCSLHDVDPSTFVFANRPRDEPDPPSTTVIVTPLTDQPGQEPGR